MNRSNLTHLIKQRAEELGFSGLAIAKAEFMTEEAKNLEKWLNMGNHGTMQYMENHFDKRVDPTKLVPGAKSVISLIYNYFNPETQHDKQAPKLSMYAYGKDYHKVVKKRALELFNFIKEKNEGASGRVFVDSAPVLERDWAKRSGLGWIGKHSLLISLQKGSYFFLAEIICDIPLDYDQPIRDHCGTCTRCIEACPTDAISKEGYILDSTRCISYLTIEHKSEIPDEFKGKMENYMFGCDICQVVCPWNRFSQLHNEPLFSPKKNLMELKRKDWLALSESQFNELFEGSAVKRTKYKGLKRNIDFLQF